MAHIFRISSVLLILCLTCPAWAAGKPGDLNNQLAFAASSGLPDEIKKLVQQGADPNQSFDTNGTPALSLAAQRTDTPAVHAVEALLDAKADVNIEDPIGQTPLYYAARKSTTEMVRVLLTHGADAYHNDKAGHTARDVGFKVGRTDSIKEIDDYLHAQTQNVLNQYEERNKQIEAINKRLTEANTQIAERDKAITDRDRQMATRNKEVETQQAQIAKQNSDIKDSLAKKQDEKKQKLAKQDNSPDKQEKPPVLKPKPKDAAKPATPPPPPIDTGRLSTLLHDLSYHVCAAEYWRFMQSNHMETGMKREDLHNQIEAHHTLANQAAVSMKKDFGANDAYLGKVTNPSATEILSQVEVPITNVNRRDEGMGTRDDMDTRCGDIADQWELVTLGTPTVTHTLPTTSDASSATPPGQSQGGGGGGAGGGTQSQNTMQKSVASKLAPRAKQSQSPQNNNSFIEQYHPSNTEVPLP